MVLKNFLHAKTTKNLVYNTDTQFLDLTISGQIEVTGNNLATTTINGFTPENDLGKIILNSSIFYLQTCKYDLCKYFIVQIQ